MDVGFTGTREGMTPRQQEDLRKTLLSLGQGVFHHGDCIGADAEAHRIARDLGWLIVIHPPENEKARAFMAADAVRKPEAYMTRNAAIVRESLVLIAAPKTPVEQIRSGTWATVRRARFMERTVIVLVP